LLRIINCTEGIESLRSRWACEVPCFGNEEPVALRLEDADSIPGYELESRSLRKNNSTYTIGPVSKGEAIYLPFSKPTVKGIAVR